MFISKKFIILTISTLMFVSLVSIADINDLQTPKMRVVDRDWKYFKDIPCEQLKNLAFNSRSEEILLTKRKMHCQQQHTDKYKAFFKKPVSEQ